MIGRDRDDAAEGGRAEVGGIHAVAAAGFDAVAETYERARPSYPAAAVDRLADRAGIAPGRRVVDLAAGTGKLTVLLAPFGADLVAVEPVAGMRAELVRRAPGLPVVAAVAEALPFADGTLDVVTVAQAFHWFDPARATAELARTLRPGGRLALLWNTRDRTADWVDRVWSVMDRIERDAPWRDPGDGTAGPTGAQRWTEDPIVAAGPWSPFERATFAHVHRVRPEQVVDRMLSVSHVAVLPPDRRAAVLDEVRAVLASHPDTRGADVLEVPYRLDVLVTERLGSGRPAG